MSSKKEYKIGTSPQLIDMNQDLKNFHLTFRCTSKIPNKSFSICALTQKELDQKGIENIDLKDSQGSISGTIISDDDVYHNYVLVIKAPEDTDVVIEIQAREIPPNQDRKEIAVPAESTDKKDNVVQTFLTSKWFLILVLACVALFVIYYLFFYKKPKGRFERLEEVLA
jgi:hypothetical protein